MKTILTKSTKVYKGKHGKYGAIKIENKKLAPFIGKELDVTIKQPKKKVKGAKKK